MSGLVVWFTGLPSSGKTTLARETLAVLRATDESCCLLDGDEVRECLHPPLCYDAESRANFYETLGSLAALLSRQGLTVLVAATAHRRSEREAARRLARNRIIEVFVDTPLDECVRRDPKGLYKKAQSGEIVDFPGIHEDYEPPGSDAIRVSSGGSPSEAHRLVKMIQAWRA
jgi:adenylylsulfate kinase